MRKTGLAAILLLLALTACGTPAVSAANHRSPTPNPPTKIAELPTSTATASPVPTLAPSLPPATATMDMSSDMSGMQMGPTATIPAKTSPSATATMAMGSDMSGMQMEPTATLATSVPAVATMDPGMDMGNMQMPPTSSVPADPARGKLIFQNGPGNPDVPACSTCHNADSPDVKVGPSLAEIGHHGIEHAKAYGQTIEAFLRESIVEPNRRIMIDPNHVFSQNGVSLMYQTYARDLTEQQIDDLVAYLLTLK